MAAQRHTFERSRHLVDFHLAGFAYHDGLEVIEKLTLGKSVTLAAEPDNPHDPYAVAVFFRGYKLGYVPSGKNEHLSQLLYFGYDDIFEARIQSVNMENHPERQFRVVVRLKDRREM
ncbi:restriction endonuclease [Enterococcus florum]|uniref:Restriction endonuclease n=1 Tax=Enterococcus florum TaxID=2480627 RepID=A0A4P5PE19_9ENTE|nr:HIRAN domain-containing protein [Enterococcus florum]GCF94834.1 restriction endonuclease [Enterococcus florum]